MDGNIDLRLDANACKSIDEYVEYKRIVGDDDGGVLFTPEEYKEYKEKVAPIRQKNRLFVSWASPNGIECKMIGPQTVCFCQHRYTQHKTDHESVTGSLIKLPCQVSGCLCASFHYAPMNGTRPIRCRCKHFTDDHKAKPPYGCRSCPCKGFYGCYTCGCGEPAHSHYMIVETKDQRLARGRPVGQDTMYKAMGGLTGFSSLAEGYMRLDDSGIGRPDKELLEKEIDSMDHPFLKVYEGMGNMSINPGTTERRQTTEEEDMAFFERRYQERLKKEREEKRLAVTNKQSRPTTNANKQPTNKTGDTTKVKTRTKTKTTTRTNKRW